MSLQILLHLPQYMLSFYVNVNSVEWINLFTDLLLLTLNWKRGWSFWKWVSKNGENMLIMLVMMIVILNMMTALNNPLRWMIWWNPLPPQQYWPPSESCTWTNFQNSFWAQSSKWHQFYLNLKWTQYSDFWYNKVQIHSWWSLFWEISASSSISLWIIFTPSQVWCRHLPVLRTDSKCSRFQSW